MTSRKHKPSVPNTDPRHKRPRKKLSVQEMERRLDVYEDEARAGLPDGELARLTGIGVRAVRSWRAKRKIQRSRSGPRELGEAKVAMNLLGEPLEDVLQRSVGSATRGRWEPPQYLIRQGVDYDQLCWQIYLMHKVLGLSLEEICQAHGYTMKTVSDALAIEVQHLKRHGSKCGRCGMLVEPAYEYGCSGSCMGLG